MGEKPSPLPACAEASAGRGEDFSLIVGFPVSHGNFQRQLNRNGSLILVRDEASI